MIVAYLCMGFGVVVGFWAGWFCGRLRASREYIARLGEMGRLLSARGRTR